MIQKVWIKSNMHLKNKKFGHNFCRKLQVRLYLVDPKRLEAAVHEWSMKNCSEKSIEKYLRWLPFLISMQSLDGCLWYMHGTINNQE